MSYKAFISYSHAADGQLAPTLQSALQRFAKPFYRLRAMNVFRDKTSLHLTPGLWPLIQQALNGSEYFLLLASSGASNSQWVQAEVGEWLKLKNGSLDTFLIVLTEGEIVWDDTGNDFDWERTTALPTNLKGKFKNEPLYSDLRWAKKSTDLSLRHPQFLDDIGTLAAALHGKPKDMMIGKDVRQHRLFKLVTTTVALLLLVLSVVASVATFYANNQKREADEQRQSAVLAAQSEKQARKYADEERRRAEQAAQNEKLAREQEEEQRKQAEQATRNEKVARRQAEERRVEAEQQRNIAEERRREAERQSKMAFARQLAAQSELLRNQRADLLPRSTLLAVEAVKLFPSFETDQALRQSLALMPMPIRLFTHEEEVKVAAISPDAKTLVTVRWMKPGRVWDIATGREVASLPYDDVVGVMRFSPKGKFLVMVGRTAQVWETATWRPVARPIPLRGRVHAVAFSSDEKYLGIAADDDEAAQVWEVSSGTLFKSVGRNRYSGGTDTLAFSPKGDYLATSIRLRPQLWKLDTGEEAATLKVDSNGRYNTMAFSPDGSLLAYAISGNAVNLVNAVSGEAVANLPHLATVTTVVFSNDGKYVATISGDNTAKVWGVKGGNLLANVAHERPITALVFSPDGHHLATASEDNTARIWRVADGSEETRIVLGNVALAIAFSPDGNSIVTVNSDSTAGVWEAATGSEAARITSPKDITGIKFSPDEQHLSVVKGTETAVIVDTTRRDVVSVEHKNAPAAALSPDGKLLAVASGDVVRILDAVSRQEIKRLEHLPHMNIDEVREKLSAVMSYRPLHALIETIKKEGGLGGLTFSLDGRYLTTERVDGLRWCWDIAGGRELWRAKNERKSHATFSPDGKFLAVVSDNSVSVKDVIGGKEVAEVKPEYRVEALVFSPQGHYLITIGNEFARVWDLARHQEIAQIEHQTTIAGYSPDYKGFLDVSPDEHYLVTVTVDKVVHVWQVQSGQKVADIECKGEVKAVAFSPNGEWLAMASEDNTVRLWSVHERQEVTSLPHVNSVTTMAFSKDGKLLATASNDQTALVWDLTSKAEVAQMRLRANAHILFFSPDTQYLATAGHERDAMGGYGQDVAQVWPLWPHQMIRQACARLNRSFTEAEWKQYHLEFYLGYFKKNADICAKSTLAMR